MTQTPNNAAAATQSIIESTDRAYDLSQLQLIKLNTLLKAYYYTLYMTESKHLIQTQQQYRLPLLVTFKKNNYTWNGLMDSIASLPDDLNTQQISMPGSLLPSTHGSTSDDNFRIDLTATINTLKPQSIKPKVSFFINKNQ